MPGAFGVGRGLRAHQMGFHCNVVLLVRTDVLAPISPGMETGRYKEMQNMENGRTVALAPISPGMEAGRYKEIPNRDNGRCGGIIK